MNRYLPVCLVGVLLSVSGCSKSSEYPPSAAKSSTSAENGTTQSGQNPEDAAVAAAQKWLTLVDSGKYAESWDDAAAYFKNAVAQDQWEKTAKAVRAPLGAVVSRKVKSATYTTTLPGAPDGEYVVIQFATSFKNKKSAIETVTPMLEKDGTWRVSGYFIK